MGLRVSTIGATRLILSGKPLEPGGLLKGAIELKLTQAVQPKMLTFTLQSKERTVWLEEKRILNPVTNKYQRINVDVGSTDVQSIVTSDLPITHDMQFPVGNYTYHFELTLPPQLKPAMYLYAGDGEAHFSYHLKVNLSSSAGEHVSLLPLPSPSDEERVDNFSDPTVFSQGFGQTVTFKPVLKETGVVNVYARLVKGVLASKQPLEVVLDLDNTRNPYDVRNAYFSLERTVLLKGENDRQFPYHEIVTTHPVSCLPVQAKSYLQNYRCSIPIPDKIYPTFTGLLISQTYKLNLILVSGTKISAKQTVVLSEVTVVSELEQGESMVDEVEVPLEKDQPKSMIQKLVERADWKTAAMNAALGLTLKVIEALLKRK